MYLVPLLEDETLTSFCSRLAAANATTAPAFCLDMGVRFYDVIGGRENAIQMLADIGAVPLENLRGAAIRQSGRRSIIGDEAIVPTYYVRTKAKFCPVCFLEDDQAADRRPGTRRYNRRTWGLQFIRTCQHHDVILNDFGRTTAIHMYRHDFVQNLMSADIPPGLGGITPRRMSNFERFAIDRLASIRRHGSLLDPMPLEVAGYACEVLGCALMFGIETDQESLSEQQIWEAGEAGYQYLSRGVGGLHEALDVFHARIKNPKSTHGGGKLYGRFHRLLLTAKDPAIEPIRAIIHKYAFEKLPLPSTANVFGTSDAARYLSSRELSAKFDVTPVQLRKFAVALGLMDRLFLGSGGMPVDAAQKAYEVMNDTVRSGEAARILGLSLSNFTNCVRAGLFVPIIDAKELSLEPRYSRSALLSFVDSLKPVPILAPTKGSKGLSAIASSFYCKTADVVAIIKHNKLQHITWDDTKIGLAAVRLDPAEFRKFYNKAVPDLTLNKARLIVHLSLSAISLLCEEGHLPSHFLHDKHGRPTRYIKRSDLAAFDEQFVTFQNALRRYRVSFKRLRYAIAHSGVQISIPLTGVQGELYNNAELASALNAVEALSIPGES